MIVDSIYDYINKSGKEVNKEILEDSLEKFQRTVTRQFMEDDTYDRSGSIYPSQMGKECARHLAYRYLGFDYDDDMAPRTKMKFFLGDLSELAALTLAKLSGLDIGLSQSQLEIDVNGFETHGYIDGFLYENDKEYVVECKSKGKYGFQRFEKNGFEDNSPYMTQINLYMRNLGVEQGVFLVVNTDTGHIAEEKVQYNQKYVDKAKENVDIVLNSSEDNLPDRLHKINDFKWMPRNKCYTIDDWKCQYCSYKEKCWGKITTDTVSGKPKHRIYQDDFDELPDELKSQISKDKL